MKNPLTFDGLQTLLWDFAVHRVITVSSRVGILGHLARTAATPEQVAEAQGLDPYAAGKMIRALTALGVLESTPAGYQVVETLRPNLQDGPDDMKPFLEHSHQMYERWGENLEGWVRGETWTTQKRGSADVGRFGAAMEAMGRHIARRAIAALDLSGVRRVLDVGGGFGHYAKALCRAKADLVATVLDRPEVVELARERLAGDALEGRITFLAGDYLEDYSSDPGYDLVLCVNILHQERDERAAVLVSRAAAALAPGGRLVVLDFAVDDAQQQAVLGALFAINMRSFGDTHPEPRIRGWMERAGLSDVQRVDLGAHRWLVVGRRPALGA